MYPYPDQAHVYKLINASCRPMWMVKRSVPVLHIYICFQNLDVHWFQFSVLIDASADSIHFSGAPHQTKNLKFCLRKALTSISAQTIPFYAACKKAEVSVLVVRTPWLGQCDGSFCVSSGWHDYKCLLMTLAFSCIAPTVLVSHSYTLLSPSVNTNDHQDHPLLDARVEWPHDFVCKNHVQAKKSCEKVVL